MKTYLVAIGLVLSLGLISSGAQSAAQPDSRTMLESLKGKRVTCQGTEVDFFTNVSPGQVLYVGYGDTYSAPLRSFNSVGNAFVLKTKRSSAAEFYQSTAEIKIILKAGITDQSLASYEVFLDEGLLPSVSWKKVAECLNGDAIVDVVN